MNTYRRIRAVFRDVEDVINHRKRKVTFTSPLFSNPFEEAAAVDHLRTIVRKRGFTAEELLRCVVEEVPLPDFSRDDDEKKCLRSRPSSRIKGP